MVSDLEAGPPIDLKFQVRNEDLEVSLHHVIYYGGPGSWKRKAYWDEYVFTIRNVTDRPILLSDLILLDPLGDWIASGQQPWELSKTSKKVFKGYENAGIEIAKTAAPVIVIGVGAIAIEASAGIGMSGARVSGGGAAFGLVAVYYGAVLMINQRNKKAVNEEFDRRLLNFPITVPSGVFVQGSVFFPMIPSPRRFEIRYGFPGEGTATSGSLTGDLSFLKGLHERQKHSRK